MRKEGKSEISALGGRVHSKAQEMVGSGRLEQRDA